MNIVTLIKGINKPHDSREYRLARIELQRSVAPILAILVPVLLVIVLIVVTAVQARRHETVEITVAPIEDGDVTLDPEPEPEPEPEPVDPTVEVAAAIETSVLPPTPPPTGTPTPAPDPGGMPNAVAPVKSPVSLPIDGAFKPRGLGDGAGGGFGQVIEGGDGGGQDLEGALIGTLCDFKRDAGGKTRGVDYWKDVGRLFASRFSPEVTAEFYQVPKKVALTHLFIEPQDAENGPKAFGAEKLMEPKGWIAHYEGALKPSEKARYRFVGAFDDALVASIDGKVVLECTYGSTGSAPGPMTGWTAKDKSMGGRWPSSQPGCTLVYGDWFEAEPGKPLKYDLVIGERPGGMIGGILLIEQEGATYEKDPSGRPVLPIFATRPLSIREKMTLEAYSKFRIGTDSPRFNAAPKRSSAALTAGDVAVEVTL